MRITGYLVSSFERTRLAQLKIVPDIIHFRPYYLAHYSLRPSSDTPFIGNLAVFHFLPRQSILKGAFRSLYWNLTVARTASARAMYW